MKKILLFLFTLFLTATFGQKILKVNASGMELRQFYLNKNVENLWIGGQHVNWETGEPDNPNATKGIKTHCSSFVAAVCKQKNIYILRPPRHKTGLLANAQYDWLFTEDAYRKGWRKLNDSIYKKAQELANNGIIVTVAYKNPNPKKPGHIALIMPVEKSTDDLFKEGPTLIQAGQTNKNFISLKEGFIHHISDWSSATNNIVFFYNENNKKSD
jgi:hypothetical protein